MTETFVVDLIRLAIAAAGLAVNVWTGLLIHRARRRHSVALLTRGEEGTLHSAATAGAFRFLQHAGFATAACYLVIQRPAVTWLTVVYLGVQLCTIRNDLGALRSVRRTVRLSGGEGGRQ